jgi:hypothetical protein
MKETERQRETERDLWMGNERIKKRYTKREIEREKDGKME